MKKRIIQVVAFLFIVTVLLSSCDNPSDDNLPGGQLSDTTPSDTTPSETTPTETTPQDTKPAFVYDPEKYPLSESLASKEDVKEVGILSGGVIVEGLKYAADVYSYCWYDEKTNTYGKTTSDMTIDIMRLDRYIKEGKVPEGCPIIKYASDFEIIDNTGTDDLSRGYYNVLAGERSNGYFDPIPTKPGVYLISYSKRNPNDPEYNKEITPVIGEGYVTWFEYYFAVVVE